MSFIDKRLKIPVKNMNPMKNKLDKKGISLMS